MRYHVAIRDDSPEDNVVIVQIKEDKDCLSPDIKQYCGTWDATPEEEQSLVEHTGRLFAWLDQFTSLCLVDVLFDTDYVDEDENIVVLTNDPKSSARRFGA